jgi:hypothetical protein
MSASWRNPLTRPALQSSNTAGGTDASRFTMVSWHTDSSHYFTVFISRYLSDQRDEHIARSLQVDINLKREPASAAKP